jgi:hypothetical protein
MAEDNNQSPETEDVEAEAEDGIDLDKWWEEKEQGLLAKLGIGKSGEAPPAADDAAGADGTTAGGDAAPASSEPPPAAEAPPAASPAPVDESLIERMVNKVIGERDHHAEHEKLAAPPEPKPPRKGLGKMIWGA